MTPEQIEQERAAFEAWYRKWAEEEPSPLVDIEGELQYKSTATQQLFAAWCGRAEQGGWISVEDRLPETEGYVIVAWANGYVDLSRFTRDKYSHGGSWHHDFIPDDITHWQPLPQPPKGDPA